jgi:nucleotide-binding universal stress UspA family protein
MKHTTKITRILAPTDMSGSAEEACRLAARLANRFEAELVLFYSIQAIDVAVQVGPTTGRTQAEVMTDLRERLLAWFHAVVPEELRRFLTLEAQVAVGEPAQSIAWAAKERGADFLVMATHGRTGFSHLVMGSVAESVLRTAPAPVLVLRTGQEGRPLGEVKRILCATDLSATSEEAWRYGLMLADVFAAEVSLLHVVSPLEFAGLGDMRVPPPTGWLEGRIQASDKELARKQEEIEKLGLRASRRVKVGAPAATIVAEAQDARADLIVIGTHGRTGLSHLLLGSVAEAVIRKAPCPILAVQARPRAESGKPGSPTALA